MTEVRSAARVLSLLEFFANRKEPATLALIAEIFALPKSSTLNLLRTLLARGYIVKNDMGSYEMNDIFRKHGFGWGGSQMGRLSALARPCMETLRDTLEETIAIGYLTNDFQIKLLLQSLSHQPVRYVADEDVLLPAYCTAMGRAILSHLPEKSQRSALDSYPPRAHTAHTITDIPRLMTILSETRVQGYATSVEEYDIGGTGVAAVILDESQNPIAALNVATVTSRFEEKKDTIIITLTEAASYLSDGIIYYRD